MNKRKRLLTIILSATMLLSTGLTASAATPRNNWCCPGAADIRMTGMHDHKDGYGVHDYVQYKCVACGKLSDFICYF